MTIHPALLYALLSAAVLFGMLLMALLMVGGRGDGEN